MEEVLHYLELKNDYYEKFYLVTKSLLEGIHHGVWNKIHDCIDIRERILKAIHSLDYRVAEVFLRIENKGIRLNAYGTRVRALLKKRAEWITQIVALDLELISRFDDIKSEHIRELKLQHSGLAEPNAPVRMPFVNPKK